MKLSLAFLLILTSFSTFASNLAQDLSRKDCSIEIKKSLSINKKDLAIETGEISLFSLFHQKKIKLNSGEKYEILDVSDGTLAINHGTNLIFICINDGETCLKDLTKVKTTDIYNLSNKALQLTCR